MPDIAERKKYGPLRDYLAGLPSTTNDLSLTFDNIAQIVGSPLPPSAVKHREWWANQDGGSRAPHWRAAGFKVDHADLVRQTVRFKRLPSVDGPPEALTLQQVVTAINKRAQSRPFGRLPEWRKDHKEKKSLPATPFYSGVETDRSYVFHVGGLSELQFNLGFEPVQGVDTFRQGVAFSLQTTRELPTIDPLVPKIARFNEYLHLYPDAFVGFEMWHWTESDRVRSENYSVAPIPDAQVQPGTFIVLGRLQPPNAINLALILDDFDRLLPLYEYVEGTSAFPTQAPESQRGGFIWSPGNKARVTGTSYNRPAGTVEKSLRHNWLQPALYEYLFSIHGDCVSGEQQTADGTYIDVAVRQDTEFTYYEIKTGLSAQACIREALGQILEYSYWPGAHFASRLVIVGEPPLDETAKAYLQTLRTKHSLPVEYQRFDMTSRRIVNG